VRATITDRSGRDLALFSKKMLNFSASDVRNLREEPANEQSGSTMSVGLDSPEKEQE
jgi:hypothetical protein